MGAAPARGEPEAAAPRFAVVELYAPGHFGNSYEVMGENEMRRLLEEAVFWGFNRYGDWFDTIDCADPFVEKHFVNQGHALWDAKKANFRSAQALGLPCDLIVTPNHVYLDQCVPGLRARNRPAHLRPTDLPLEARGPRDRSSRITRTCSPIWPARAFASRRCAVAPTITAAVSASSASRGSSPTRNWSRTSTPRASGIIRTCKCGTSAGGGRSRSTAC